MEAWYGFFNQQKFLSAVVDMHADDMDLQGAFLGDTAPK